MGLYNFTEYDEITEGMSLEQLEKELAYQYKLGYSSVDSYPQYLLDKILIAEKQEV